MGVRAELPGHGEAVAVGSSAQTSSRRGAPLSVRWAWARVAGGRPLGRRGRGRVGCAGSPSQYSVA